nr:hypothetical protein Hi04_10k_c5966_00013 [uncultured bacterium]
MRPGATAQIATPDALSRAGSAKALADQARANNTPVVLVTVGILKPTYSDRSAWKDKEALKRNISDDGRAQEEEGCPSLMRPRWRLPPLWGYLSTAWPFSPASQLFHLCYSGSNDIGAVTLEMMTAATCDDASRYASKAF